MAKKKAFLSDIKAIRKRARQHIEQGAVTAGYLADRATVIRVLNEALATELVCSPLQAALLHGLRHQCTERGRRVPAACQ